MAEKTEGVDPWYEFAKDFAVGQGRPLHSHRRVQLLYASAGVMLISRSKQAKWRVRISLPSRAGP